MADFPSAVNAPGGLMEDIMAVNRMGMCELRDLILEETACWPESARQKIAVGLARTMAECNVPKLRYVLDRFIESNRQRREFNEWKGLNIWENSKIPFMVWQRQRRRNG